MVEWWLSGAGSRRSCEPEAEATGLAPKQAADRHDPLALPSEGFVLVDSAAPPAALGAAGQPPPRRVVRSWRGLLW